MPRQVCCRYRYRWRLRELMAERCTFSSTGLVPLLHERGITLSASRVHRLVTGPPVADTRLAMRKPDRALKWPHDNPRLPGDLQALARRQVPLTHDGLHRLDSWRTAEQLHAAARTRTTPINQHRRLSWTRRVLTDNTIELRTRVAAGLPLLIAQPPNRIVTLTVDDVLHGQDRPPEGGQTDGQDSGQDVYLRLGEPPRPIHEALAGLLLELVDVKANVNTASNPDSRWLFPGGRQRPTPGALRQQFQARGLPTIPARTAALDQLVPKAPAPMVATVLGHQHGTTEQQRLNAGGAWSRYSAPPRHANQT